MVIRPLSLVLPVIVNHDFYIPIMNDYVSGGEGFVAIYNGADNATHAIIVGDVH